MKKTIFLFIVSWFLTHGTQAQDISNTIISSNTSKSISIKNGIYYSDNGQLFSGLCTSIENGKKRSEIEITEGKANGKAIYFYDNGSIMETGMFLNGEKNGEWLRWNESGKKTAQAFYSNGKKDGLWMIWDDNGTKRYEMNYALGEKTGKWLMWNEKGELISEKVYSAI